MGAIKSAIGDFVVTFMWVFCASTLGVITSIIGSKFGVEGLFFELFCMAFLILVLLFVFGPIGDALGGATFNPTDLVTFYAAGVRPQSLFSASLRLPAQAAGAAFGALAIMEVIPKQYKHMVIGPSLKVDLHTGAIAEGVLTFGITFLVLLIVLRGPKNALLKNWLIAMSTVALAFAGSAYTGPAMNPAIAFGWAYVDKRHNTWEQFYVFWVCPFVGAILSASLFRVVFPPPAKQKTA
ncbi:Aquaporin SIP [Heracleum sosnowskyi]|uniref:Aquaporin SIP n=1 Tax=Heracleum sosnowskyi TaxID=360622 RepID=A0AAD8IYB8_9APIA|nr:Aquaporin SIP [Heracleum sosnowskyi]